MRFGVVDEWVVILVDETHAQLDSSCAPSFVFLFLVHQTEGLALKSSKNMVNKELHEVVSLKPFSKFDKKFSNSKLSWFRDTYIMPTYKVQQFVYVVYVCTLGLQVRTHDRCRVYVMHFSWMHFSFSSRL